MYTLKKQKHKLKLWGLGPFVINDITSAGAVRLETLDGEPMANHINGNQLQIYHELLMDSMLEHLHAAKRRKEAEEEIKQEAQREA